MDTPYIAIDLEKLKKNIADMAEFAARQGIKLRPHVKAHKIPQIAKMQLNAGAVGIAVAKLGEAEVMFSAGIEDIVVAYPLVGESKLKRVRALLEKGCKLTLLVDSAVGAQGINSLAWPEGIDVLVKVDTGLRRCGLPLGKELEDFCRWVNGLPHLNFKGLLTHAGHAYACRGPDEVKAVGMQEGRDMVAAAEALRRQGLRVEEISIGSTPTAKWGGSVPGVTEIRPGNYVFYDAVQVALGAASPENCSLRVMSTVVSRPARDRAIIDAGAKVLALDRGAHGSGLVKGFGVLSNKEWTLARLSEEHGILEGKNLPEIGTTVGIIPNHACPVVNLAREVFVSNGEIWEVSARGCTS